MFCAQRPAGKSPSLANAHSQSDGSSSTHDEHAVALLDDRQTSGDRPVAHARRPPTVTTTSSPRTLTA